jgi:flavodoxin
MLIFIVAGCGKPKTQVEPQPVNKTPITKIEINANDKILVAYFSVPESDNAETITEEEKKSAVVIDGKVLGNTQYVAQIIQQNSGADIFRIEPVTPYPMNHGEIEQIATQERRNEALPEILNTVENFDSYKIIFVGYPIWYGNMPRILYSFLKSYNFAGKTIVPFITSGGSGFGNTINEIKYIQPDANVIENGLSVKREVIKSSEQDIKNWLSDLGF